MAQTPRILAFAGSSRTDSYNKKLIAVAVEGARQAGAEVTLIDLRDYPLPIYDGDLEANEGLPANGRKLKDLFLANDGLLIASPEYNSSFSALLKNTIDWVSRPVEEYPPLEAFIGKVALLLSASPGRLGGLRGLYDLRKVLGSIKVTVLPEQQAVPNAGSVFAEDGSVVDEELREQIMGHGARLAEFIAKIKD